MIFEIVVIILLLLIIIFMPVGNSRETANRLKRIEEKLDKYLQTEEYNLREWDGKH